MGLSKPSDLRARRMGSENPASSNWKVGLGVGTPCASRLMVMSALRRKSSTSSSVLASTESAGR